MVSILDTAALQASVSDEEIVSRVVGGETGMFEILMRRHNRRLYRAARAILRDDNEAEDVMQDTYVRAFEHLNQFAGLARFSTWLTRIAVHEALARRRRINRYHDCNAGIGREGTHMIGYASAAPSPEEEASGSEMQRLLDEAVERLPESYRIIFMLRDVEEMSTAQAAEVLDIGGENVKVRLHRARGLLRKSLYEHVGMRGVFAVHAVRSEQGAENLARTNELTSKEELLAA
jgi:RNA polymerase sigma-70 factor (ECF subfamily)